jgi:hypothetical protein
MIAPAKEDQHHEPGQTGYLEIEDFEKDPVTFEISHSE